MKLIFHTFDLRLKHTFTIAHDSRDVQPVLIVELQDEGFSGFGEATSNKYYGVTIGGMIDVLETHRSYIEEFPLTSAEEFWKEMNLRIGGHPFAQCALDEAAHDLVAKKKGLKLYESWGLDIANNPITDYTIGISDIDTMVAKLKEFPWPLYKIKLGTGNDLEIVRELRKHTDAVFRVDANCAWTAGQCISYSEALKNLGVEFIEQPLPADDISGMREVYNNSAVPVIADESCIVAADVARCAGLFHGVNVKLTKCGGLTPALGMLAEARQLGMKTMVGCMNESSVGISAIAQLLPLLDYVDMDGTLLIANDPATGVMFDNGRVVYADENGTGARLKRSLDVS